MKCPRCHYTHTHEQEYCAACGAEMPKESYVLMPKKLTAENGAKHIFMGEFKERIVVPCQFCDDGFVSEDGEICEECEGAGSFSAYAPVQWTTIKEIYKLAVKHLSK